jgi:large repetitive protein
MISSFNNGARVGGSRILIQLLAFVLLLLGAAFTAQAENCSDYPGGILDGFAGTPAPDQLQIDRNCTIRNYPASNPLGTNFSFLTQPGQTDQRWLVIFDNVVHTGQMACNAVAQHRIWFVNGSSTSIKEGCQNYLIPVEKIDKKNPDGQTTATIGVPFTYKLTMPVLFAPATNVVIDYSGSADDLHSTVITDDLNATGADLTYISHVAYWEDTGAAVPHTFSNAGGLLTFSDFPIIPAGRQIIIELTVVLDDTPANAIGTQFVNTAKWFFGRLIDNVFYEPLPGEWGVSPPLTIAAPRLVVDKTGPATLNIGQWGQFSLSVQNTGLTDAWDVTILDRFPDVATGGMCSRTPEVLGARVFAADGVTPVPGKGPLTAGIDFSLSYNAAPTCELSLAMLTAAGVIGPNERLVITYRTQLDADTQDGVALTNVAGAIQWFNAGSTVAGRQPYTRTLTDGTVGTLDHEDAHTVVVAMTGYFFEKTVANRTTGVSPAITATTGDTLRYTLRLRTTNEALVNARIYDELDALNASAAFVPGTLTLVAFPAGADISNTSSTGGPRGTGVIDIRNLNVPAASEISVQFDVRLAANIVDGTTVANQSAARLADGTTFALSDDPNVNGQADPSVMGDEDPTRVVVTLPPPTALAKANTQLTAAVGEVFTYRITVPAVPDTAPLYNVRILDDLTASAADLRFISVTKVSGSQPWTPVNTGTATSLVIEDTTVGIDIPAGEQIVVEIAVQLENTTTNVIGLQFTNTAAYVYSRINDNAVSQRPGSPGTTPPMTIIGPDRLTLEKAGPVNMTSGGSATFTLDVNNPSTGTAWGLTIIDLLPNTAMGGMCDAAPTQVTAQVFQGDGVTPVSALLVEDADFSVTFAGAPDCTLRITMLSEAAAVTAGNRMIVRYQAQLDVDSQTNATFTNIAGATEWFSADPSSPQTAGQSVTYTRVLTDGTVGLLDHEDAHTVNVPALRFEKTVANVTTNLNPAVEATPGDRLRYSLRVTNLGDAALSNFSVRDEIDRLNASAAFVPGTLTLVAVPSGADTSNTSATGGAKGTGLLDVRNLTLAAAGSLLLEFEVTLAPVLANSSDVLNQSQLLASGAVLALSDDPNINGAADPGIADDEDPTRIRIVSAPDFRVLKTSTDLTGDPAVLLAGETLRYTITVQNVGTDNSVDAILRDQVPVNTTYVAGTTTLNGAPLADAAGLSPLVNGLLLNSPANATPGAMPAGAAGPQSNVATVTFDVVIDPTVVDGTVISNQGFVSSPAGGVTDQPSDDPATPIVNDPTRDVVGNLPLLYADKRVVLYGDQGSPGTVDPGDVLRYTITVQNSAATPATGLVLVDAVPANTTYVANSTQLDGAPYGQPDGGAAPLAAGIDLGTLTVGNSVIVQFDLRVNDATPAGTVISNQAVVRSVELPNLLTDGDANPATGPEPTVVVVGDVQRLSIAKQVSVVGGGPVVAGAQLEYSVRVVNIATVPAVAVVITDDLALQPGQLTYVDGSASMNGSAAGVGFAGTVLTGNYSALNGPLQPGEVVTLRFRAVVAAGLPIGTTVRNTGVVTWNTPAQTASASVSIDIGGVPGTGVLNGAAWHDANFDDVQGGDERALSGWSVDLYRNDQLQFSTFTDTAGAYRISGLVPNDVTGNRYELRFRAPGAGPRTALLGRAASPFTNGLQRITDIVVASGANAQGLNLPLEPNGVVYNSVARAPIPGATLTLLAAGSGAPLPTSCLDDAAQQGQVTLADGFYKFDINFSDAACPSGGDYLIGVTAPGTTYIAGYSQIIPPTSNPSTAALAVAACRGSADDAIPTTPLYCEAQPSVTAPATSVPARSAGTIHHVHLRLDGTQAPGTSQIFNNHIPLDPELSGAVAISKKSPLMNVTRGQLVPYVITVNNIVGLTLTDVTIVDRFPAGFSYVEGSARLDGVPTEPTVAGRELAWSGLVLGTSAQHTVQLLLAVGAGVSEGEYVNRAQVVLAVTGNAISGEATATVRVVPDPTFDCTDVTGKVFDDANRNGLQDDGEAGLAGVRLVTARGLAATTDQYGRYHITCAVTPDEARGSNFVLKLDDRTLPSGFRMSNEQVQVKRATRGKALRFNFGASVHRVVGIDLADAAFEPGTTRIRVQWRPRLDLLLEELRKEPAVLRLSYVADTEDADLVERRLQAVKKQVNTAWEALACCYLLTIEPEIFWRLGGPPKQPVVRVPESR